MAEIAELVAKRQVRGRHIPLAISDHGRGQRFPLDTIQTVPEMGRPVNGHS